MADDALTRLTALEGQMTSLLLIEPHIRFYTENIQFFEELTTRLDARLQHLEEQVKSHVGSSPPHASEITTEVMASLRIALEQEVAPLRKTIAEVKDASEAATYASNEDLTAHKTSFESYCHDSNKNFATKSDLAAAQLGSADTYPPATTPPKVKMPAPAEFSGKRPDWKTFISHMNVYFTGSPKMYSTDSDKILYTISRLGDNAAFKYMQRYIADFEKPLTERPDMIKDYSHFCKIMKKTFGVQNADIVAEAQLTRLTQGTGSTLDYTNRFMELAADIEWNDPAKISAYRKGLNPEVLRMISIREAQEPTDLTDYTNLAIDFDQKLFAQNLTSRTATARPQATTARFPAPPAPSRPSVTPSRFSATPTHPTTSGPTPMDLSNTTARALTDAQKAYRKANNLCMYCEKSGHYADKCPILAAKGRALGNINATETMAQDEQLDFHVGKDQA